MAAVNPRINITVSNDIANFLEKTAKLKKKSISKVALELIEWAIEEREDLYFSQIGDARVNSDPQFVSDNEEIWK